jgi:osmotically-inducible protein OsmY
MDFMDTDTQVFQDIVEEFNNRTLLHTTRLSVHVQDGIVTISGRVNTCAQRKAVERAVKRVAGIKTLILKIGASLTPLDGWQTSNVARSERPQGEFQ